MTGARFDTSALTERPSRSAWHAFRREAAAGGHGADLAGAGRARRHDRLIIAVVFAESITTVAVTFLVTMGTSPLHVALTTLVVVVLLAGAVISVRSPLLWTARARHRFRMTTFARLNGLGYQVDPQVPRPAAHVFGSAAEERSHVERVEVRMSPGFLVGNYAEDRGHDTADTSGHQAGYAVFRLRESYPHTLASTGGRSEARALRDVEPVDAPPGFLMWSTKPRHAPLTRLFDESGLLGKASALGRATQVEIVGDELFLLRPGGHWDLRSPGLWSALATVADALAPFLAQAPPRA